MTYWLRLQGTRFPIRRGETTIGRSPYCSIVVSNGLTSRRHCAIRLEPEGLVIADLGSSNGTAVNGELLDGEQRLEPGDILRIGTDELEVLETPTIDMRARAHTQRDELPPEETTRHRMPALSEPPPSPAEATLDLVEGLIARSSVLEEPATLEMIQRAIEALLAARAGPVNGTNGTRIRNVVRALEACCSAARLEPWRSRTLSALAPEAAS